MLTEAIGAKVENNGFSNWVSGSSSFSFIVWVIVTLPGHASLRSLFDALVASLQKTQHVGMSDGVAAIETKYSLKADLVEDYH